MISRGAAPARASHRDDLLRVLKQDKAKAAEVLAAATSLRGFNDLWPSAVTIAVSALGKKSLWTHALEFFFEVQHQKIELDVVAYNAAIGACKSASEWELAVFILKCARRCNLRPDVKTYSTSISAAGNAGEWRLASNLFSEGPEEGIVGDTAVGNAAASAYAQAGRWESALLFLDVVKPANVITWNSAIKACAVSQNWEWVVHLLAKMLCDCAIQPTSVTFTVAMTACKASSRWDVVHGLLQVMQEVSCRANVITYGAAMQTCTGAFPDYALQFFDDMRGAGMKIDVASYNVLAGVCENSRRWELTWQLLKGMKRSSLRPAVASFVVAVRGCGIDASWRRAATLLTRMGTWGFEASLVASSAAITACERCARWIEALRALDDARTREMPVDTIAYNAAISACEKGLQWVWAVFLLGRMRDDCIPSGTVTFSAVLSACEKCLQWERAVALLGDMRVSLVQANRITYSATISACEKASQWTRALSFFGEMQANELLPDTISWNAALSACDRGDQWTQALELWCKLRETWLEPTYLACKAVVGACTGGEQHIRTRHMLDSLLSWLRAEAWSATASASDDVGFAVEGLELLGWELPLGVELTKVLLKNIFRPSLLALQALTLRHESMHVQRASLERLAGLGAIFTRFSLSQVDGVARSHSWAARACSSARRGLRSVAAVATQDPVAQSLVAAAHGIFYLAPSSACAPSLLVQVPFRAVGYGDATDGGHLVPVFVEHDRSPHCERQALLSLLASLNDKLRQCQAASVRKRQPDAREGAHNPVPEWLEKRRALRCKAKPP